MDRILIENRRQLLFDYFVEGKLRIDVLIIIVYIIEEERIQGKDISNVLKVEIFQRVEEKIYYIIDEYVKGLFQSKFNEF